MLKYIEFEWFAFHVLNSLLESADNSFENGKKTDWK